MREKLPVNTEVMRWARTSLGLSIENVAEKMKKEKEIIEAWENGEESPTYPQLEKLAYDVYQRPVAVFFFPDVPKVPEPKTDFRTLPDTFVDALPAGIIKLYREAKSFQYNLEELFDGNLPNVPRLLDAIHILEDSSIPEIARQIRKNLEITKEIQSSWKNPDEAFKAWRLKLEERGIFVFKDAFKNDNFSGFCLYDDRYPVIYINNSMPSTRQIFTLLHELGHLLYRAGGVDFTEEKTPAGFPAQFQKTEQMCNRLAAEILLPADLFSANKENFSKQNIDRVAIQFSISREVVLRRFLDAGVITNKEYHEQIKEWKEKGYAKKDEKEGGNYYLTQKAYLGETYTKLAFSKYYQNKIDSVKLSELLNIKPKNLQRFEHYLPQSGKV